MKNMKKNTKSMSDPWKQKKCSKKLHYFDLIAKCNDDIIKNLNDFAEHLNKFLIETGSNLAKYMAPSSVIFKNSLKTLHKNEPEHNLSIDKPKYAFFSLKLNRSLGYYEIKDNVIKKCFKPLYKPVLPSFNQSLQNGIFLDELKVTSLISKGK